MSHVYFDQYAVKPTDLIFLPPEILKLFHKNLSQPNYFKSDIWTLGMILLHCMCLTFQPSDEGHSLDQILKTLMQAKNSGNKSLISLDEKEQAFGEEASFSDS